MKHLGDITLIKGYEAPVVDCIIGGSPCQDLSLAGKRAGLAGARSGLYMEQIRIIKEMREADVLRGKSDVDIRPRYMVWENVPGAFSTNGGKDFAAVLEEAIRVAEPEAPDVHVPEKGWPTSGCFWDEMGKWSVAWRVLDAQFWGTSDKPLPQRRRRIALVADFGGLSASEILFVRKSVSGNLKPGKPKGKEASRNVGEGSGGAVGCDLYNGSVSGDMAVSLNTNANATGAGPTVMTLQGSMIGRSDKNGPQGDGVNEDVSFTLNTTDRHAVDYGISPYHSNCMKSDNPHSGIYEAETSRSLDAMNCGYPGCNQGGMAVVQPVCSYNNVYAPQVSHSLKAKANCDFREDSETYIVAGVDCRNATEYPEMNGTIQAKAGGGFSLNCNQVVRCKHIVRRLTPLECERLQGFPDGWTDIGEWVDSKGKKHKEADSPRYKALGNSIAIPPWKWVLKRLCSCYERDATMASLFDGIGGFPYIWEQLNGKGSCLWASEIEEFPMAVTKVRFGE